MKNNNKNNFNNYIVSAIIFLIFFFTLFFNFYNFSTNRMDNKSIYSDDNGTYIMTTLDAYYYLRLSKEFLNGTYDDFDELSGRPFPRPIPLLSSLLVAINKISGLSLEKIGFFLPPFLSGFSFLIFYLWGRITGGNMVFAFSGLLFSGSFFWYIRTGFGRFDTDSFIPVFIFILSYFVFEFVNQKEKIKKSIFFLSYLVVSVLFIMWWVPAKYLFIPCFIIPYSLSYFFYDSYKLEKQLKLLLIGITCLGIILVFFDTHVFFPEYINNVMSDLKGHIKLVEKSTSGSFGDVGKSITELLPVDFKTISFDIIGHPFMLCFFFTGFFLMIRKHYKILIFLIFPFILSLFMFYANRFAIFFLPFYTLSVAYCLYFIFNLKYIQKLSSFKRYAVILSIFILVFIINSYRTITTRPLPVVTQYDIKIARTISEKASKDAIIWTLWDYGYFLQYYAERKTIIDGGSQNPEKVFISSLPLSVNDMQFSANLMKFFAAHEIGGLMKVYAANGDSLEKTVLFLARALSKNEDLKNVFNEYKIKYDQSWEEFLFPSPEIYLFLNSQYFEKSYWWYYFATYRVDKKEGIHPFTSRIDLNRSLFDVNKGLINIDSNIYSIKELNNYAFKPTPGTVTSQIYRNEDMLSMFVAMGDNQAYLMDYLYSKNIFVKLFFFTPIIHNNSFKTIAYAPLEVGVWKVQ